MGGQQRVGRGTNRASYAYDGAGQRVVQNTATKSDTITTTDYLLGGLEEQQTVSGSIQPTTTLTEYYPIPGVGTAVRVSTSGGTSSTLSYLARDGLGSVSVALDPNGNVTAQQLYSPYGMLRYSSGSMPTVTDHGYTGQVADSFTGLDDYGARSYDPTLGQFASADTVAAGGLNRYAYVGGNPASLTDPSGHKPVDPLPPDLGPNPWIDLIITIVVAVGAGLAAIQQWADTPVPMHPAHLPVPVAAPSAQPVWSPPAASPGSAQWTLPDQNAIRGAENAHSAPQTGPTNPGPGAGPTQPGTGPTEPAPGATPATQTGSGGANGGAGTTPPTGSCGCYPDESGGSGGQPPVLQIDANRMPNIARNVQAALDEGYPSLLTREMDPAQIRANRTAAIAGFDGAESPDEYPFASTQQGGAGARAASVPLAEQRIQGGVLSQFYQAHGIGQGDPFRVEVINLSCD